MACLLPASTYTSPVHYTHLPCYTRHSSLLPFMPCWDCRAAAFAFGLATTLALLGVLSSFLGKSYGQIGDALPIGQ